MSRVTLPDPLLDHYGILAADRGVTLEQALTLQLTRFQQVKLSERILVLQGKTRERLETLLGGGQLASTADLVAKIERWAGITIGGIRVDFSPGQLEEIARRADKRGITPEEEVRQIVARMETLFFDYAGV